MANRPPAHLHSRRGETRSQLGTSRDSQLRSEFTRSTALLALTSITSSVSTLTVTTVTATATAEWSSLALFLTEHAAGRGVRSLLLDVGGGHNLGGQVKPFAQVVEALGGQGVVVVLPRELGLDIAAGVEGLASLDDEQVLGVDVGVLGKVEVLLGHEDTLAKEVLVIGYFVSYTCNLSERLRRFRWVLAVCRFNLPRGSSCGRPWESTSWRFLGEVDVEEAQNFGVKMPGLKMDNFCGRKPYEKFEPSEWGGL